MAINKRQGKVFASGLLLGAAAVAGAWLKLSAASSVAPDPLKTKVPLPQSVPDEPKTSVSPPQPAPDELPTSVAPPQSLPDGPQTRVPPPWTLPDEPQTSVQPPQPAPDQPRTRVLPPPKIAMLTPRQLAVFASAFVLAAAALAGAWMTLGSDVWPLPVQPKTSVAAATQAAAPASQEIAACPLEPAAAVAGEKDGRFPLQSDVSGLIAADIASFIVFGKEAAAAGRPRDAEVAFLMSCRVADQFKGAASVQSADARYQLGSHYARLVFNGSLAAGASRAELLNRAERLYADSLHTYGANHGEADEKSRFAAEGLARVRQTLAQAQTVQAAPVRPVPAPAQPAREAVATTTEPARSAGESTSKPSRGSVSRSQPRDAEDAQAAAAAPKVAPPAPDAAMRSGPSFNCAKARSVSEVIICSDPQLTELDRDLSRVYARARKAASDPAAFQRRSDEEWRLRESICRNRECLLRWYAQRHEQLMNDLQGRKQPQSTAYR